MNVIFVFGWTDFLINTMYYLGPRKVESINLLDHPGKHFVLAAQKVVKSCNRWFIVKSKLQLHTLRDWE